MLRLVMLRAKGKPAKLQQRLTKPVVVEEEPTVEIDDRIPYGPKHLGAIGLFGVLPGLVGSFGMMISEFNHPVFHNMMIVTGSSLGTSLAFLGGSVIGYEVMKYTPDNYSALSVLLTKGRLWFGLLHCVQLLFCIWCCQNESWRGFMAISFGIGVSSLYTVVTMESGGLPLWFNRTLTGWSLYNAALAMFLAYNLFNKESLQYKKKPVASETKS